MRIKYKTFSLGILLGMIFLLSSCSSLFSGIDTHLPVRKVSSEPKKMVYKGEYLFEMNRVGGSYGYFLNGAKLCYYRLKDDKLIVEHELKGKPISQSYFKLTAKEDQNKFEGTYFVYTYSRNKDLYLSCIRLPYDRIEFVEKWETKTICEKIIDTDPNISWENAIYLLSRDGYIYQKYDQDGNLVKTISFKKPVLASSQLAYDGECLYLLGSQEKYFLHAKEPIDKAFFPSIGMLYDGKYFYKEIDLATRNNTITGYKLPGLKDTYHPLGLYLTDECILYDYYDDYIKIVSGSYDCLPIITSDDKFEKKYKFGFQYTDVVFFYKEVGDVLKVIACQDATLSYSFDSQPAPNAKMLIIYQLDGIPGKLLSNVEMIKGEEHKPPERTTKYENGDFIPPNTYLVFNTTEGVYECDITRVFENVYIDRINNKTPGIILDHGKITDQRNGKDKIVFYKPEVRRILPENDNKK